MTDTGSLLPTGNSPNILKKKYICIYIYTIIENEFLEVYNSKRLCFQLDILNFWNVDICYLLFYCFTVLLFYCFIGTKILISRCVDHKSTFPDTHRHFRLATEISRKLPIVCGALGGLELKKRATWTTKYAWIRNI